MLDKILILDFGSQTTQLIARRVRDLGIYCEVVPYRSIPEDFSDIKGVILSGSPYSIHDPRSFRIDVQALIDRGLPILAICYGAQLITGELGGTVEQTGLHEYGRTHLSIGGEGAKDPLLRGLSEGTTVWMSHSDSITVLPEGFEVLATTENIPIAVFRSKTAPVWGVQFHPEAHHSEQGSRLLGNFIDICGLEHDWTPASFIDTTVAELREQLGEDKVILALSGGVDSSVCATLLHRAIGDRLYCIFVNHGLLRKGEFEEVMSLYKGLGLNVKGIDAVDYFYSQLEGVSDPEQKRKIIGKGFIDVFAAEAHKLKDVKWLAQGTIYPDVIESLSITGTTIKSHHNVGGLPEDLKFSLVEPLRKLFKDEVRKVGEELGMPHDMVYRQPFPGPGLAIRILGDITPEKVRILQEADHIFISRLREAGLYDEVWQAGAILLPVHSVGVMGDERTYDQVIALRAVTSVDAMSADWAHLPYDFLARVSSEIINTVDGVNRCVYDISSKPPSTIEWE